MNIIIFWDGSELKNGSGFNSFCVKTTALIQFLDRFRFFPHGEFIWYLCVLFLDLPVTAPWDLFWVLPGCSWLVGPFARRISDSAEIRLDQSSIQLQQIPISGADTCLRIMIVFKHPEVSQSALLQDCSHTYKRIATPPFLVLGIRRRSHSSMIFFPMGRWTDGTQSLLRSRASHRKKGNSMSSLTSSPKSPTGRSSEMRRLKRLYRTI